MEYPKIHSLWKRTSETDHTFLVGDYSCEEFGLITRWSVEEKIDGMNVRIVYEPSSEGNFVVSFLGRSKDSKMSDYVLEYLKNYFTIEKLFKAFGEAKTKVTLYGEVYGFNVQASGPFYKEELGFMLFDIFVGHWWFTREAIKEKAVLLGVPTPPELGMMTEQEIIEFVKSKPQSRCSIKSQVMEGIIARTEPVLLFRNGRPVVFKLKVKDFIKE